VDRGRPVGGIARLRERRTRIRHAPARLADRHVDGTIRGLGPIRGTAEASVAGVLHFAKRGAERGNRSARR